ncbi:TerC family protein [Pseudonocardia sp. C8]|uniref:TerC family protein n=1 Tax=Pseudonocardia sp. C8 TaxID=2762759 RepID=UPI001642461D|nr:TerC family protein [Pseudonocardia sp. C8]
MNVPLWLWLVTIGAFVVVIGADLWLNDHKPHAVTLGEVTRWVVFYIALAVAFGLGVWYFAGGTFAGEFFAGYLTEYSLSVDNLFVFLIIMSAFKVPVVHQHKVLLVGIVIALLMRSIFIAAGAAVIERFSWVFYLFAAFLIYTAFSLVKQAAGGDDEEWEEGRLLRWMRKVFPVTDDYHGAKTTVKIDGKRWLTPMLIVMVAIGMTDIMFALDSIPAIFGLTQEAYLVFTANAFALMGLRQLYFLLGGLLNKLVFLSYGLAVLLAFIGVKLALHALHENELPFLNGGEPLHVPDIGIGLSLSVIIGVLAITTIASLVAVRIKPELADQHGALSAPPLARSKEEAARLAAEDEKADHHVSPPSVRD